LAEVSFDYCLENMPESNSEREEAAAEQEARDVGSIKVC